MDDKHEKLKVLKIQLLSMTNHPHLHDQLQQYLSQYSHYCDQRHLTTLSWMVVGLLLSQSLCPCEWEPYVVSRAQQAASYQKRWSRFWKNPKINPEKLYLPLVMAAISNLTQQRIYLALDTSMLWNQYCMIHVSIIFGGRAIPLIWDIIEHKSASVAFEVYQPLLRKTGWLLRSSPDVMLLADRGFANKSLVEWLKAQGWHWGIRVPSDVLVHGVHRWRSCSIAKLTKVRGEVKLYHQVRLWEAGVEQVNLVLAYPQGMGEAWSVMTDESPSLSTLWQYSLRFGIEELFLDSKSGVFGLSNSRLRDPQQLNRLYLVLAIAILYGSILGITLQTLGLRRRVDPHWQRGLSYLKIGLRWLRGTIHKGRKLLSLLPFPSHDPEPCFASRWAEEEHYERLSFSRVRSMHSVH